MTNVRCRVMTFNVRYDTDADGENAWGHRRELVASIVRFHAPDVVGLQEPLAHQYSFLREELPDYSWEGMGRIDGDTAGEHCPIGWRDERVRRTDTGTVWLSETPSTPGSSYPDAKKPRLVTWARLVVEDKPVVVCNTHFDHQSERARIQSAQQLRVLVEELRAANGHGHGHEHRNSDTTSVPVVVLGDFNCTPASEPYRLLTAGDETVAGTPLTDAMVVTEHPHHGPTATFERFGGEPTKKIDHVFVAGDVDVRQHGVLGDHWDGRPPSDHCPVMAELML